MADPDLAERVRATRADPMLPCDRLSIGVTGHRLDRLGVDRVGLVTTILGALFADIERAARPLDSRDLRLVTSLADGADSIAADAAVERGWRLDTILPFFREDHEQDYATEEARDHYLAQLASCSAVMELPGDRAATGGEGVAYECAGRVMLAQCDLLVAIWDGEPSRGRGGAPQIIVEAVLLGIPVIHVDPSGAQSARLLWDGLEELDLGQQTIETVARADLDKLPGLICDLLRAPEQKGDRAILDRVENRSRWSIAIAYPLLLAVMGIRSLRRGDFRRRIDPEATAETIARLSSSGTEFAREVRARIAPRFAHADAAATRVARLFRSVYVTNFAFAALAVILSLLGLVLPAGAKPVLIALEVAVIATILIQTRMGNRGAWHRLWLDNRALAERLRCLAISAQLGELDLRGVKGAMSPWVAWYARATARELGLPNVPVDQAYLRGVRSDVLALIDDQVAYLSADCGRMHRLDHRLHRLGAIMFGTTVVACGALLLFKAADAMLPTLDRLSHPLSLATTIISAALPAIGAAIYGIRMQGDFAGIAERNHALAAQLSTMRDVIESDVLSFDTLARRVRRVTALLTIDLESWLRTYDARPLTLPG